MPLFSPASPDKDPASGLPLRVRCSKDGSLMLLVAAGTFRMGSPEDAGHPDEHPAREVRLRAFYIDECEVTVDRFSRFCAEVGAPMPEQPPWSAQDHPVVNVSFAEAAAYCSWAAKRLPTEAEWEKAARGGAGTRYPFGDDEGPLADYAWFKGNSEGRTHPVASLRPCPPGLYDMLGNVWEWTSDWYDASYYGRGPAEDPRGPDSGQGRVLRGGSWTTFDLLCRCAARNCLPEGLRGRNLGFRCAADVPGA